MSTWRNTREYRVWRVGVIRRDKVCVVCTESKGRHAHHKNHATYFKDMRFLVENGVCLCSKCHIQFHNNFKRSNREKCTSYDFENFLLLSSYMLNRTNELQLDKE